MFRGVLTSAVASIQADLLAEHDLTREELQSLAESGYAAAPVAAALLDSLD